MMLPSPLTLRVVCLLLLLLELCPAISKEFEKRPRSAQTVVGSSSSSSSLPPLPLKEDEGVVLISSS